MRSIKIGLLLFAGGGIVSLACSASSTSTTGMDTTGGGSTVVHCGIFTDRYSDDKLCDACLHQQCCTELAACAAVENCLNCYYNSDFLKPECDAARDLANALIICYYDRCSCACVHPVVEMDSGCDG